MVQHTLHAFTPHDQQAVKRAADTMRGNPGLDICKAITELAVGEALRLRRCGFQKRFQYPNEK